MAVTYRLPGPVASKLVAMFMQENKAKAFVGPTGIPLQDFPVWCEQRFGAKAKVKGGRQHYYLTFKTDAELIQFKLTYE